MPDQPETERERRIRLYEAGTAAASAINACPLCDDEGTRRGLVCDHQDHSAAAKRGKALCLEALRKDRP